MELQCHPLSSENRSTSPELPLPTAAKEAMSGARPQILENAATLADLTRCRILLLLQRQELTVSELCDVLQLPQSTVSRHLKVLMDGGWLRSRRDGTSHLYQRSEEDQGASGRLWQLLGSELATVPAAAEDHRRLESVLAERRSRSQEFFSSTAGRWDRLRDELFGHRFDLLALAGLLDGDWIFGDLACGTGRVAAALAPFVSQVIAVDGSAAMLEAARGRLEGLESVEVREGHLECLPIADGELDAAALFLALHHLPQPEKAVREAARALKPGGRLLLVDMLPHGHEEYRQEMGHVWLGFSGQQIETWLANAGFEQCRIRALSADPEAKGPGLFAATARQASGLVPEVREGAVAGVSA